MGGQVNADNFAREDTQPDLYLVEPGGVGGSEVKMYSLMALEPGHDSGVLMGAEVIHNDVKLPVRIGTGEETKKVQEFNEPIPSE